MTHRPRIAAVVTMLLLFNTVSLFAAPRRRVVTPPTPTATKISGTVVEAGTEKPVVAAEVAVGRAKTQTDAEGKFELEPREGGSVTLAITRSGFEAKSVSATVGATGLVIVLTPLPTTTVTMQSGQTIVLDTDSVLFAALIPLSGYNGNQKANFCKPGGGDFTPDRSEIAKITGPSLVTTNASCCSGPVESVTVELKTGERTTAFFKDSCVGYHVDLIGRAHSSGTWQYLRFTEVAQVVFP